MSDSQEYARADYYAIVKTHLNPGGGEKVHHFRCSKADFARFERALERGERESIGYKSLSYDGETEHLKFVTNPTSMHEAPSTWLNWWVLRLGLGQRLGYRAELLEILQSRRPNKAKQPDAGLFVPRSRPYPTMTIESGYSERYEELVEDAKLLLGGTNGYIGVVILVRLTPLKPGEDRISDGFLQAWGSDYEKKSIIRLTRKENSTLLQSQAPVKKAYDLQYFGTLHDDQLYYS